METEALEAKLQNAYNKRYKKIEKRVLSALHNADIQEENLSLNEIKTIANFFIEEETKQLENDVAALLAQKEAIERALEKKSDELQEKKYEVFHALEEEFSKDEDLLVKLHQVKLQSIDLYDILAEMVESAIITALEKDRDGDITEPLKEVIKEITFESIKEGSLNTIRVRKILSTILATAIDVADSVYSNL